MLMVFYHYIGDTLDADIVIVNKHWSCFRKDGRQRERLSEAIQNRSVKFYCFTLTPNSTFEASAVYL